jgi:DNA polymerase-3 subunit epsilon
MNNTIIIFDIESTSKNPYKDRIIQFSAQKINLNFTPIKKINFFVNPTIPIHPEATLIHHINDEMVKDKKPFSFYAKSLHDFFKDSIISGYNIKRFDIPMLYEEFSRCGIEWDLSNTKIIDSYEIFSKKETRNLKAAYKFYCGIELSSLDEELHDSNVDVDITLKVTESQLFNYGLSIDEAIDFCYDKTKVDLDGKIILNKEGVAIWNFGKYYEKNMPVINDKGYCDWVLSSDFSTHTKMIIRKLLNKTI